MTARYDSGTVLNILNYKINFFIEMVNKMNLILKTLTIPDNLSLVISKASVDDAAKIINFLNKVGGETDFLTFGANEFPLTVEQEKETIVECLERNICLMLIAKVGDEIVSQLFLQRSNKQRLAHISDIAVSVSKDFWGKSIGKHMMLTAIEWAKQNKITKIQLQVQADNDRAVQLYKNLGFNIEGKITRATKINENYHDDLLMGLEL